LPAAGASKAGLAELMVGRSVAPAVKHSRSAGAVVCELQGASVQGDAGSPALLEHISLALHAGEVLAIAGVAGNGQQALAELLCGERALSAGTLTVGGAALPATPRRWVEAGVARIPEDRHAVGVVGDLPIWENAVLERYATPAFARAGFLKRSRARVFAHGLVERYDVRGTESAGVATRTRALSGGNMQKLILGRALMGGSGDPDARAAPLLIVANQPTWGLDIGAVAYVHQQLLDACAGGSALLLISEDLDEIFALADRIAVMHHGRLSTALPSAAWSMAAIGMAMAGTAEELPA
jgi:general nucleoside transport system ATP-binding protein